jgi:hypothetical protein
METKSLDWKAIASAKHGPEKNRVIREEIDRVGHVILSDCLVNRRRGGSLVLEVLENRVKIEERKGTYRKYKLKVLRDHNGGVVRPGDVVRWKQQIITRTEEGLGRPLTSQEMEEMKRRGDGDQLIQYGDAEVDGFGCIEVSFLDAAQLLNNHGQHYQNADSSGKKTGICPLREVSTKPTFINGDQKQKRYRWNWLYEEVPPGTDLKKWTEPDVEPEEGDSVEDLEKRIAKLKADKKKNQKRAELLAEEARLNKEANARSADGKGKGK